MKFLILSTDYLDFLSSLYARNVGLQHAPYEEQMRVREGSLFGVPHSYRRGLTELGHEAHVVHANNEWMQLAWMSEQGAAIDNAARVQTARGVDLLRQSFLATPLRHAKRMLRPILNPSPDHKAARFYRVLGAQIEYYQPDVILNQSLLEIEGRLLRRLAPRALLVGQIASPLPDRTDFGAYQLMISASPHLVSYFRQRGVASEFHRLGFDTAVLRHPSSSDRSTPVSFVGSVSSAHMGRITLLERLCKETPLEVWGEGIDTLPSGSQIRLRHRGLAWGSEMYRILRASRITINQHIDVSGSFAGNLRLYEATGCGALLITDWKQNLSEMFEPDEEVVCYRTAEECVDRVRYYLQHEDERAEIAKAGQERTLREHNFTCRMKELVEIVARYV